jgi:hypothetical protein
MTEGIAGDALREQKQWDDRQRKYGRAVKDLDRIASTGWGGGVELQSIKVRFGVTGHVDTLVVLTAKDHEGAPVVAFYNHEEPSEALVGAIRKVLNGSHKWRPDRFANGKA